MKKHTQQSPGMRYFPLVLGVIVIALAFVQLYSISKRSERASATNDPNVLHAVFLANGSDDPEERRKWDESVQGKLLQSASPVRVSDRYAPVLIYRMRGTNRPAFTAVGTEVQSKNGPIIVTVEHLLMKKFTNEQFVVRRLSPDLHQITNGIESIAYKNVDLGLPATTDVVFLKPGDPHPVDCYSEITDVAPYQFTGSFTSKLDLHEGPLTEFTSVLTGKTYPLLGGSSSPQRFLVGYESIAGESGTGFFDRYGNLYVLSGGPRGTNISMLSGPFSNLERHL